MKVSKWGIPLLIIVMFACVCKGAIDGFETGDFSQNSWSHEGDAAWEIVSSNSYSGSYCAMTGQINDNEESTLSVTADCSSGNITFCYKVSSEKSFDKLSSYIDGAREGQWSGEKDWTEVSFPVAEGTRTFSWTYSKDYSQSQGDDTAWIDDIEFPVDIAPLEDTDVVVYPRPGDSISPSEMYRIDVIQGGRRFNSFVYQIEAQKIESWRHNVCSFTTFSFENPVIVEVTKLSGPSINSCKIYPSSYGIYADIISDNQIRFEVSEPMKKMAIIFNDDWVTHPLLIFADPLEEDVPAPNDEEVIYFAPGVHDAGMILPESGQTVYIAGGAYVKGAIYAENKNNIKICGRGILSQEDMEWHEAYSVCFWDWNNNHDNLVKGITIIQQAFNAIVSHGRRNHIQNVKMVGGWLFNSDGLDAPSEGIAEDCFLKCNDDAITFYENTIVRRNVIWQMENGAVFQIGWKMPGDNLNYHIYDCDVIRTEHRWNNDNLGIIDATFSGCGHMHEFLFEDIRVENAKNRMFNIHLKREDGYYDIEEGNGEISDILIRNFIAFNCDLTRPEIIRGIEGNPERPEDEGRNYYVHDITFEDLQVNGKFITNANEGIFNIDPDTTYNIDFISPNKNNSIARFSFDNNTRDDFNFHHGKACGVTYVEGVNQNPAVHFDGNDDYIEIPKSICKDFSIAFWVRTTQTGSNSSSWWQGYPLIDAQASGGTRDFGTSILDGRFAFGVAHPDTTIKSTTNIADGSWHHLVATRNGTTGMMKIYIDGIMESSRTGPKGTREAADALYVGRRYSNSSYFRGDIDELNLFYSDVDNETVVKIMDISPPHPNPAFFEIEPEAISGRKVFMRSTVGSDENQIEYFFDELTGNPGGSDSGWQDDPNYTDTDLEPETQYSYTVTMRDKLGNITLESEPVNVFTNKLLPDPWRQVDIGYTGGLPGNAVLEGDIMIVSGADSDILWRYDEFCYVYQSLSGNGEITARVSSLTKKNDNANPSIMAGVMIRESTDQQSKYAMVSLTANDKAIFSRRSTSGNNAVFNKVNVSIPYWIKLARNGNTFTGYISQDGDTWNQIGTTQISMSSDIMIGLFVTSHWNGLLVTAEFEHVTVE